MTSPDRQLGNESVNKIKIEEVNPFENVGILLQVLDVYIETFGNEPWNEGFECTVCKSLFPLKYEKTFCEKCFQEKNVETILNPFWTREKVLEDLKKEMSYKGAEFYGVFFGGKVVGLSWGYLLEISRKNAEEIQAPGLEEFLKRNFFYIDECAILPEFQNRGIGNTLLKGIISGVKSNSILRTLDNSPMCKLVKSLGGEVVMNISMGRVIMKV
jgi:hypothetical protein